MSDRFKLIAWDKGNKCMVNNDYYNLSFDGTPRYEEHGDYDINLIDQEDLILMQCTGQKDIKAKLIFEGHLLRRPAKGKWEENNFFALEVFWHDNDCTPETNIGFCLGRMRCYGSIAGGEGSRFIPREISKLEIIGHIYENPELLGATK